MTERTKIIQLVKEAEAAGARKKTVCAILGASMRTIQRWIKSQNSEDGRNGNCFKAYNALTGSEQKQVLAIACSPEFRDKSPNQIVPILAERGEYIASEATFYRLLKKAGLLTHRSKAKAPERKRPEEITATGPNQVWTWDISYFRSPVSGVYFYLYLILDIWDRSIVGWEVHEREAGDFAADLLNRACIRHGVRKRELTVHQDNGSPMISSDFLAMLLQWGRPSYSRPGVSDDNPYSESLFRTVKYRPDFPGRFETIEEAIVWVQSFVEWYNTEHRHSGIKFVTPEQRRNGEDIRILETRRKTYEQARMVHPERWSRDIRNWDRPEIVTLNPNKRKKDRQKIAA